MTYIRSYQYGWDVQYVVLGIKYADPLDLYVEYELYSKVLKTINLSIFNRFHLKPEIIIDALRSNLQ